MYSDEQVFVWDIDDLIEIAKNPTPPNIIAASATLRRLLTVSGQPLIHKVVKGRDFKLRFKVIDHHYGKPPISDGLVFHWSRPDPGFSAHTLKDKEIGLDEFLKLYVGCAGSSDLTVKQMINYVANVGGGVHKCVPKGNKDNAKIIHESSNDIIINGFPYPLAILLPVINIVLETLMPLYQRVRV
jgi:hypothetical protein